MDQQNELEAIVDLTKPKRRESRPGKRKPRTKHVTHVSDPVTGSRLAIPDKEELSASTDTKALVRHVKRLTNIVTIQATLLSEWRLAIADARKQENVSLSTVTELANAGASQKTIATLLGFSTELFKMRKDVSDAWQTGRAELELLLGQKQIQTAMKGNPLLQIFLGKQILGQVDTPTQTNVQVNVDTGSSLRSKIKEHREQAREEWRKAIDTVDVEVGPSGSDGP